MGWDTGSKKKSTEKPCFYSKENYRALSSLLGVIVFVESNNFRPFSRIFRKIACCHVRHLAPIKKQAGAGIDCRWLETSMSNPGPYFLCQQRFRSIF